jgi:cytoskeletal protein CcmA (bactofilin family)
MSEMKVGGSVSLKGSLEFKGIDIGGSLSVDGDLTVREEFKAGGSVKISGDLNAGMIKLGGSLSVLGRVSAKELQLGGSARIGEGVIKELSVGGSLKADIVYAENARISGAFEGVLIAKNVIVERKSKIRGRVISENLLLKRKAEVDEAYAVEVVAEREAEVSRLECIRCRLGKKSWAGLLRYKENFEDEGAEIDKSERVEEIPELEKLKELEKMLPIVSH